jgi:hypothetical protein
MNLKVSLLFNMSTVPYNLGQSRVHTGGWSETHWWGDPSILADFTIPALMTARARLLPATASIVGYRRSAFNLIGNKMIPAGSSTAKLFFPGSDAVTDLPQVALMLGLTTSDGINSSRISLRCIPDYVMVGGEYKGDPAYRRNLTLYMTELIDRNWGFVGRDLNLQAFALLSLVAGVVTVAAGSAYVVGDFIRFLKVKDKFGIPITGSYRVITAPGGGVYTLAGLDSGLVVLNSGLVRKDVARFLNINGVTLDRAVVRKIGRPSESYRGRSSRRR